MKGKIMPVDRYELRNAILKLPGVWVCDIGWCIPVEALNNAIDDMQPADLGLLANWLVKTLEKAPKTAENEFLDHELSTLLTYNEIREYAGMKPLNGHDEFLEV